MEGGALAGRRVIELCDDSGAYCGKLFADAGADVIKVEPPGGDPSRGLAPLAADGTSFAFHYRNAGKRSLVLDLQDDGDRRKLFDLIVAADLVVESFRPGAMDAMGLSFDALRSSSERLVMTSITGFGQTGPHAEFRSSDLIANAMGGVMYVTGEADDPPVTLRGDHAHVMASTCAAASSLIAMLHADRTGRGQHVDISVQEVVAAVAHVTGAGKWLDDGIVPRRMGSGLFASIPSGAFRCRDGLIYLMVNRPAHWQGLARWIHEVTGEEAVLDPIFEGPSSARFETREIVEHFVERLTERFTVEEVYREGQRRHLAFAPVSRLLDIVADEHLQARKFFVDIGDPGLRSPRGSYRSSTTSVGPRGPAPEVGSDRVEEIAAMPRPSPPKGTQDSAGALAGIRVVEFSAGMAGPWIGRFMAYHGADVIKIESRARPDVTRQYVSPREPEAGVQTQHSPWLTDWNAGKRCVTLDLTKPNAVDVAVQLVSHADVVVENYATGVMEKLGLTRERLFAARSDLVMLSSTGYGDSGPCRNYISWGPNIEALSGLSALDGFPGRDCTMTQYAYPDSLSALHGLFAVLAALDRKRRVGEGDYINMSQLEASIAVVGELFMEAMASGSEPDKLGNASFSAAPHGCYRSAGEDRWCAIAVLGDDDWKSLCRVIGRSDLADDPKLADLSGRLREGARIDGAIEQWTVERDPYAAMNALQAAGVAAGVVQTIADKYERDEHLRQRGYFEAIPHAVLGKVVADGIPTGLTATPGRTAHAGRGMGADNRAVFVDLLGISEGRFQELVDEGSVQA